MLLPWRSREAVTGFGMMQIRVIDTRCIAKYGILGAQKPRARYWSALPPRRGSQSRSAAGPPQPCSHPGFGKAKRGTQIDIFRVRPRGLKVSARPFPGPRDSLGCFLNDTSLLVGSGGRVEQVQVMRYPPLRNSQTMGTVPNTLSYRLQPQPFSQPCFGGGL